MKRALLRRGAARRGADAVRYRSSLRAFSYAHPFNAGTPSPQEAHRWLSWLRLLFLVGKQIGGQYGQGPVSAFASCAAQVRETFGENSVDRSFAAPSQFGVRLSGVDFDQSAAPVMGVGVGKEQAALHQPLDGAGDEALSEPGALDDLADRRSGVLGNVLDYRDRAG
jgi:hypothetical protein